MSEKKTPYLEIPLDDIREHVRLARESVRTEGRQKGWTCDLDETRPVSAPSVASAQFIAAAPQYIEELLNMLDADE